MRKRAAPPPRPAPTLFEGGHDENGLVVMLSVAVAPSAYAQESIGGGMVTDVDVATSTLTLETASGSQRVFVAPTAAIRDAHDRALALRDINPGNAVAYEGASGPATSLCFARQFWAIPSES